MSGRGQRFGSKVVERFPGRCVSHEGPGSRTVVGVSKIRRATREYDREG